jgi:hypothetical protein
MSLAALAARFKIGKITAAKWRKKLGINIAPCKPFVAPEGFVEFMAGHMSCGSRCTLWGVSGFNLPLLQAAQHPVRPQA